VEKLVEYKAVDTAVTDAEYRRRICALLPGIQARAEQTEAARRLPQETFDELCEAGAFKIFQPKRWGGYELHPQTYFDTIFDLSKACPATGWVYGVFGPHVWAIASMANQAQVDVWSDNPEAIASSSFAPTGKATPIDGGYILDGRWKWSSGSDGCSWVIVGGIVTQPDGTVETRNFLIPRTQYRIEDTWYSLGLRGTGSNDIVIDQVFVPHHRTQSMKDAYYCRHPGQKENDGPLYRLPFLGFFSPLLSYAALGAAQGAYELFVQKTAAAAGKLHKGVDLAEETATHLRIANAISDIESSRLMLASLIHEMYEVTLAGEIASIHIRKRVRFESAKAVDRAANAVFEIFKASGSGVVAAANPIQRYVRDVLTARTHMANIVERFATLFVRDMLGVAGEPVGPQDFIV
jgi:3-hydroxy-9,10-secoandrosta-1,3,5(10)-triene-9,17-dione monooxygenase